MTTLAQLAKSVVTCIGVVKRAPPSPSRSLALTIALLTLGSCTATIEQSSLLPTLPEPTASPVKLVSGYNREDRMLALPDLGTVHVLRLTRPGNSRTVIYSGGNGSFVATSGEHLNDLAEVTGADIVTFDYPGRGGTTVSKTTDALIAFGPAFVAGLRRIGWIRAGPLYSYGFSLGGATASNIAGTGGFGGLMLEATAADIPAVARNMIPAVFRPFIRVKVSDDLKRYNYVGYAVSARTPILVIAGSADRTVDIRTARRFARSLEQAGATVTFVQAPGGHGEALQAEPVRDAVRRLVRG